MSLSAFIPSIGFARQLPGLLAVLDEDGVPVEVGCNRAERLAETTALAGRPVVDLAGLGLYDTWNRAMDVAAAAGIEWLAILNDDIVIAPGALHAVVAAVDAQPDVWMAGLDYQHHDTVRVRDVKGGYRHHGLAGWAFLVRPGLVPRVDCRFVWWCGDEDLVWSTVDAGGRAVVVEGIHVAHENEASARHYVDLHQTKADDLERFAAKWG